MHAQLLPATDHLPRPAHRAPEEEPTPVHASCGPTPPLVAQQPGTYLFPSHFGQFIQVNVNEVEFHSVRRLTLRMQNFLHQDTKKELDSAKENNTHGR